MCFDSEYISSTAMGIAGLKIQLNINFATKRRPVFVHSVQPASCSHTNSATDPYFVDNKNKKPALMPFKREKTDAKPSELHVV